MADTTYTAVDFSELPSADNGKTLIYKDGQVCQSNEDLSSIIGKQTSGYATQVWVNNKLEEDYYDVENTNELLDEKLDVTAFGNVSGTFLTAHQDISYLASKDELNAGLEETKQYADEGIQEIANGLNDLTNYVETGFSNIEYAIDEKLDTTAFESVSGDFLTSADLDDYYTKSEIDSKFGFRECEVEEDVDVEPRDIWIAFKFLDKDYNPQEHNLAIGTEESNGQNRDFKADWQLVDAEENVWMWGVTEGSDLKYAFRYGSGEQSFPLLVSDNYRDIPEEMWRQEGYSSLEAILADCDSWWNDYVRFGEVQYTGAVEIYDWDLSQATALDSLFGDNPYWRCAIVGILPELNSNASHAVYLYGRLYDITSVGKITLPNLDGDIQKLLFAMTSLQDIPVLDLNGNPQYLDRLFWQDCNVSKSSIENTYDYLNTNFGSLSHIDTFKHCGLYKDPTALDNIPASWGGNLV